MVSTVKIALVLFIVVLSNLVHGTFTNVPAPPQRPTHFHTKAELKQYLQKVHEYHAIVGRWRVRRELDAPVPSPSVTDDLFDFLNSDTDDVIAKSEFTRRLHSALAKN